MCLSIGATARFKEIDDALDRLGIAVIMPVNRSLPTEDFAVAPGEALVTVRQVARTRLTDLAPTRWGWPSPRGRPVTTFRSEGLRFPYGRCLVPAAWADISAPRAGLSRVRLQPKGAAWFCLAGFWRDAGSAGERFVLLTQAATGEVAKITPRQLIVVEPDRWAAWLDGASDPSGSLRAATSCAVDIGEIPLASSRLAEQRGTTFADEPTRQNLGIPSTI
jgi:putative SOS response-associated peptidase YedK